MHKCSTACASEKLAYETTNVIQLRKKVEEFRLKFQKRLNSKRQRRATEQYSGLRTVLHPSMLWRPTAHFLRAIAQRTKTPERYFQNPSYSQLTKSPTPLLTVCAHSKPPADDFPHVSWGLKNGPPNIIRFTAFVCRFRRRSGTQVGVNVSSRGPYVDIGKRPSFCNPLSGPKMSKNVSVVCCVWQTWNCLRTIVPLWDMWKPACFHLAGFWKCSNFLAVPSPSNSP